MLSITFDISESSLAQFAHKIIKIYSFSRLSRLLKILRSNVCQNTLFSVMKISKSAFTIRFARFFSILNSHPSISSSEGKRKEKKKSSIKVNNGIERVIGN